MLGNGAWVIEVLARQRHEELLCEAEGERLSRQARTSAQPQLQPTRGELRAATAAYRHGGAKRRGGTARLRGPVEGARL